MSDVFSCEKCGKECLATNVVAIQYTDDSEVTLLCRACYYMGNSRTREYEILYLIDKIRAHHRKVEECLAEMQNLLEQYRESKITLVGKDE